MQFEKMPKDTQFKTGYAKKTISGNVVELLEMTSKPQQPPIKRISADLYMNTETGEVSEYIKSETRADNTDSLRKTFKRIRDTVNANCTAPERLHWVTLTYAENMTDVKQVYRDFGAFWKRFKRWCSKNDLAPPEYITVIEPQARGAWHCHCLLIWDKKRPYIKNTQFREIWQHGFVKITSVKNCDNIGAYLSAYLGDVPLIEYDGDKSPFLPVKEVKEKKYVKGGRLHLYPVGTNIMRTSRGIKRPCQEVVTPDTVENEKVLSGACTFRTVAKLTDEETGKTRYLSKEYYNTKKQVSQAQCMLRRAISMGIPCKAV